MVLYDPREQEGYITKPAMGHPPQVYTFVYRPVGILKYYI